MSTANVGQRIIRCLPFAVLTCCFGNEARFPPVGNFLILFRFREIRSAPFPKQLTFNQEIK